MIEDHRKHYANKGNGIAFPIRRGKTHFMTKGCQSDKAYSNTGKSHEFESRGIEWHFDRKGTTGHPLTPMDRDWNHEQHRTRAKGEHVFLVVKHLRGFKKVRYKGLLKNTAQVFSLFALANLYLVRKDLLLMRG